MIVKTYVLLMKNTAICWWYFCYQRKSEEVSSYDLSQTSDWPMGIPVYVTVTEKWWSSWVVEYPDWWWSGGVSRRDSSTQTGAKRYYGDRRQKAGLDMKHFQIGLCEMWEMWVCWCRDCSVLLVTSGQAGDTPTLPASLSANQATNRDTTLGLVLRHSHLRHTGDCRVLMSNIWPTGPPGLGRESWQHDMSSQSGASPVKPTGECRRTSRLRLWRTYRLHQRHDSYEHETHQSPWCFSISHFFR